ncbi:hypothetical protein TrRE_jg12960 [Triparma retinervis]|uniref:FAD dependent oxidoreductase domain-containing protein n=1 Tax=Triparma retinervis TaxID=2557542 RepID=A0A9W6ZII8_9STRA|nr:hypothetical protein TrRE_jg12960 [Triparma retinervis]
MKDYDVIVVGVGAHGSSVLDNLARRNISVLGIEKYDIAHANGSSHGNSRIFRTAYIEDPRYVPLLKRSLTLWEDLDQYRQECDDMSPATILNMTGGLMIGDPNSGVVQGTLNSVKAHNLEHRIMSADEIRSTYPIFAVRDNEIGILDQSSGYIVPEAAIETLVHRALKHGATIKTNTTVTNWEEKPDGTFVVTTDKNETYTAKKGVLSVGAWANQVYGLRDILHVERRVLHWFKPVSTDSFSSIPVWIWQYDGGEGKQGAAIYGFPHQPNYPHSEGVKIARHGLETCMYTMTPNEDFLVDMKGSVVFCSPCSGHGFKMVTVLGAIVADLLLTGKTSFDISFMSIDELTKVKAEGVGCAWKDK